MSISLETAASSPRTSRAPAKPPVEPLVPWTAPFVLSVILGIPAFLLLVRSPDQLASFHKAAVSFSAELTHTLSAAPFFVVAYALVLPRMFVRIRATLPRLALHAVATLSSALAGHALASEILCAVNASWLPPQRPLDQLVALALSASILVGALYYEKERQRSRLMERRAEEAQRAALTAQLQALQARTNPHFLFNSLNTVASLIPTNPQCAEATLERLAGLFRYCLDGARRTSVTFEDELEATCDYLDVESLRLGDRLTWKIDVEEGLDELCLPPLTLQPLVENAILHGIAPRIEGGNVHVSARTEGDRLLLSVQNDAPNAGAKLAARRRPAGTGTALADLERRLAFAYDDAASLEIRQEEGGFRVDLSIPRVMSETVTSKAAE